MIRGGLLLSKEAFLWPTVPVVFMPEAVSHTFAVHALWILASNPQGRMGGPIRMRETMTN